MKENEINNMREKNKHQQSQIINKQQILLTRCLTSTVENSDHIMNFRFRLVDIALIPHIDIGFVVIRIGRQMQHCTLSSSHIRRERLKVIGLDFLGVALTIVGSGCITVGAGLVVASERTAMSQVHALGRVTTHVIGVWRKAREDGSLGTHLGHQAISGRGRDVESETLREHDLLHIHVSMAMDIGREIGALLGSSRASDGTHQEFVKVHHQHRVQPI